MRKKKSLGLGNKEQLIIVICENATVYISSKMTISINIRKHTEFHNFGWMKKTNKKDPQETSNSIPLHKYKTTVYNRNNIIAPRGLLEGFPSRFSW